MMQNEPMRGENYNHVMQQYNSFVMIKLWRHKYDAEWANERRELQPRDIP